jgi:hypothetical protein
MQQRHISLAAAAAFAAVFVLAGCGSSESSTASLSPNAKWAESFCSAVTTWTSALKSAGATLQTGNLTTDSVQAARSSAQEATDAFTSTLKSLGRPPTQAAGTTNSALGQLASQLRAGLSSIQSAIANSPPLAAVSVVTNSLLNMKKQITTAVTQLQNGNGTGPMAAAFKEAPACKSVPGV